MKLNLGCGNDIQEGYVNHDIRKHRDEIELVFDLNIKNWIDFINISVDGRPDPDYTGIQENSLEEIRAWDVIEHINDPINFMDNCWDLLKPDGILKIKACGWQNPNLHVDITHKRGYDVKSFDYFDPDTDIGKEYGFYTTKRWKILSKGHDKRLNVIIELTPIK